jgi:diguanylate cyclase (GGDEF)-like protein/PAS domain S-box-containing protein
MNNLFRPAISLMNKLRFPHKFMVLGFIYVIAVTVTFFSLYTNLSQKIHISQRELEGLALIKPSSMVMRLMQQHRGLELGLISGNESMRAMHDIKEGEIFKALHELEQQLPADLSSEEDWRYIKTQWENLRGRQLTGTLEESFSAHTSLIEQVHMFMVNIADLRGLTLESDIDLYYSIDTAILALPKALEKMGQMRAYGTSVLASKRISEFQQHRMLELITELRDVFRALAVNLKKTGHYNPALRQRLAQTSSDFERLEQQITNLVLTDVLSEFFTTSPENFFVLSTEAIEDGYSLLYQAMLPTTEALITARIERQTNELLLIGGIALLLLLAASYFFIGIYHSMIDSLRSLVSSAKNFADGNLFDRIRLETSDELKQLGDSLNEMADGFHSLLTARIEGKERLWSIVNTALDAMIQIDANGHITGWNQQAEKCFGWTYMEAVGRELGETIIPPRYREAHIQGLKHFLATGKSNVLDSRIELTALHRDGHEFPVELSVSAISTAGTIEFNAFIRDITKRKLADEEIQQLAFYDPLTKLPNRRLLMDRMQQALAATSRGNEYGAVLFIDLDNFKTLNDSLGHDKGDMLLQQTAQRLTECVREGDTIARLGGDEFVVMLGSLSEKHREAAFQSETIGEKILASLNQPYHLAGHVCHSTPSIGITLFAGHQSSIDEIMKRADISMYQAKKAGRNTIRFFDPEVQAAVTARAALESDLRQALGKGQLQIYYQAQINDKNLVIGAEALLRWTHPDLGMVPPAQFVPLAEETGLILPIGQWVLESACWQIKKWQANPNTRNLHISVNISARQFRQPGFVALVREIIEQTAINPCFIELEMTESLVLGDIAGAIDKMQALKKMGLRISLDDFGTGYSSLSYLTQLPLDQLKIDQSFVRNIGAKHTDAVIIQTIVGMANNLGITVIAEGVETRMQRSFLEDIGCLLYQGYLYGRPLPIDEFEKSLPASLTA